MRKGDLVYIPQDVYLYSTSQSFKTTKPQTALCVDGKSEELTLKVLIDGILMNVRKNHVYPMEKDYGIS